MNSQNYELFPVYSRQLGRIVNYVNCNVKEKGFLSAEKEAVVKDPYKDCDIEALDFDMNRLFINIMNHVGSRHADDWMETVREWDTARQTYDTSPERFITVDGVVHDRKAAVLRHILIAYLDGHCIYPFAKIVSEANGIGLGVDDVYRLLDIEGDPKDFKQAQMAAVNTIIQRRPGQ